MKKGIALMVAIFGLMMSLAVSSMAVASIDQLNAMAAFGVIASATEKAIPIDVVAYDGEIPAIVGAGNTRMLTCGLTLTKPLMRRDRSYGADTGIKLQLESVSLIDSLKDDPHRIIS